MARGTFTRTLGATALVGVAMSVAVPMHAQRSARSAPRSGAQHQTGTLVLGAYGLAAPGITITSPVADGGLSTNFGPGAGLMVGYALTPRVTAFAALDIAKQDAGGEIEGAGTFGLTHLEIGARLSLPMGTPKTTPYLLGSLGRRAIGARLVDPFIGESADVSFSGMTYGLGGGFEHTLTEHTTLDAGLEIGFGNLGHVRVDGHEEDAPVSGTMTTRLRVGFNWRP